MHEKNNAAYCNYGVVITKYTGARAKAHERRIGRILAKVRAMLDEAGVQWQSAELARSTWAAAARLRNISPRSAWIGTVDVGVPVLSMHSPFEVAAKPDIYNAYCAFAAF